VTNGSYGIVGTVSAIDLATNTVTATIAVAADPYAMAVDPVTGTVYVTSVNGFAGGSVSVIDEATGTVTATIAVGAEPEAVAVDPTTGTVYVASDDASSLSVIDEATDTVTATIPNVGFGPMGLAVDPTTGTIYATSGEDSLSMIDEATDMVTATIAVGTDPIGVVVDPTTHTAYTANSGGGTVSVISAAGTPQPGQRSLAPRIVSAARATFKDRKHGSFTVRAAGIPAASVSEAGALPSGVRFTAGEHGTASIVGIPAASARGRSYAITLTARNSAGKPATQRFTLKVS
jgi:YVTN family beta-propeller protein